MESSSNELLLRMELARLLRFQREQQLKDFDSIAYLALVRASGHNAGVLRMRQLVHQC
jgi:hypothetical protein